MWPLGQCSAVIGYFWLWFVRSFRPHTVVGLLGIEWDQPIWQPTNSYLMVNFSAAANSLSYKNKNDFEMACWWCWKTWLWHRWLWDFWWLWCHTCNDISSQKNAFVLVFLPYIPQHARLVSYKKSEATGWCRWWLAKTEGFVIHDRTFTYRKVANSPRC